MQRENYNSAIFSGALLIFIIIVGVGGFIIIEHYSFTEAFFMTIITMATVGFQEVRPLSVNGMWFTSILIILSFGIFFYVISTFTRYLFEGVFRNYYKRNAVRKKIKRLKNHVVICGFGRNGRQAAMELLDHKVQIVVIESSDVVINQGENEADILFVGGDATNDEVLDECQINTAKALITTLPVDSDNLFVVLSAREKNPKMKIISRASDERSDVKLKRAGATHVIMPDKIGGQQMAKMVAHPDVVEFLDFLMLQSVENVNIAEIHCDRFKSAFQNKPLRTVEESNESGANIIGLRREDGSFVINPLSETILGYKDKLFALGTRIQISRLQNLMYDPAKIEKEN